MCYSHLGYFLQVLSVTSQFCETCRTVRCREREIWLVHRKGSLENAQGITCTCWNGESAAHAGVKELSSSG